MKASVVGLLLCAALSQALFQSPFQTGKEYLYDYEARSSTGDHFFGQYASVFGYKGHITVQGTEDGAVLQLSELSHYVYNGPSIYFVKPEANYVPVSESVEDLYRPFSVHFVNGTVTSVSFSPEDPLWSRNMKQAIASQLQVDVDKFKPSHVYPSQVFDNLENTLFGSCPTHYEVTALDKQHYAVRKHRNHGYCTNKPQQTFTSENVQICGSENLENVPFHSSSRSDLLFVKHGEEFVLEHLESYNTILVQPFRYEGLHQYSYVNHTFDLENVHEITTPLEAPSAVHVGLKFEYPDDDHHDDLTKGDDTFEEFGLKPWSQEKFMQELDKVLHDVVRASDNLRVNEDIVQQHRVMPQRLLMIMHGLDYDSLKHCYDKYSAAVETGYLEEAVKQLFLDAVSLTGSNPAVLMIRDIIISNSESIWRQIELVTRFPLNLRHPSVKLLEALEPLLTHENTRSNHRLHDAVTLSFASLVAETCPHTAECHAAVSPKYGEIFYNKLISSEDYEDKLTYIQAIQNLGCPKTTELLVPIVLNQVKIDPELRYLTIYAAGMAILHDNEHVWELFLPLYLNRHESHEIRIAAFNILMASRPTFLEMQQIEWSLVEEHNKHVKQYVYTTIKSIAESKHPCLKKVAPIMEFSLRHLEPMKIETRYSGNYASDYVDEEYGFGSLSHLSVIGSDDSIHPKSIYLRYNNYFMDRSKETFSVYIRLQGLQKAFQHLFHHDLESFKIPDLKNLLDKLRVSPRHVDDLDLDLIIMSQGRTLYTLHLNNTGFKKIVENVWDIKNLQKEFSLNLFRMNMLYNREVKFPTDLGVQLTALFSTPVLTTLRGNFTRGMSSSLATRSSDYDLHQTLYSTVGVVTFNPLGNVVHGIARSNVVHYDLPVNMRIGLDLVQKHFKINVRRPQGDNPFGVVAHTQSSVFIGGENAKQLLYKSCPNCKLGTVVSKGPDAKEERTLYDLKLKEVSVHTQAKFFDCEKERSRGFVWQQLRAMFDKDSMNVGFKPINRLWLGLRHIRDAIQMAPRAGSCGLLVQVTNNEDYPVSEIEAVVKVKSQNIDEDDKHWAAAKKHLLRGTLEFKGVEGKSPDRKWDLNVIFENERHGVRSDLKVKLSREVDAEHFYSVCFEAKRKFPPLPTDLLRLPTAEEQKGEGELNLLWGESEEGKCPSAATAHGVRVRGVLSGTEELIQQVNNEVWPYKQCREDHEAEEWKGDFTPVTQACFKAALEQTLLRKYDYNVKFINLSEKSRDRLTKLGNLLRSAGALTEGPEGDVLREVTGMQSDEPHPTKDEVDVSIVYSVTKPEFDLTLKTAKDEVHYHAINYGKWPWKPTLLGTRFSRLWKNAFDSGALGACTINTKHVRTLDNVTYEYESDPCYTLASADCTTEPLYAVFVKHIDGTNKVAIKVYTGGNYVEIIPEGDSFSANINGEHVEDLQKGQNFPKDAESHIDFRVWQKEKLVQVYSHVAHVLVQYTGTYVSLIVPHGFYSEHCGLCGDFNGLQEDELKAPEGCVLKNGIELSHAYMLDDEGKCHTHTPTCEEAHSDHEAPSHHHHDH